MTTNREPLVLSESEHEEMERLMAAAGIASKRELVARAVALLRDVTAGRAFDPPQPTRPERLTLDDLVPPAPRSGWGRFWAGLWPRPLRGRAADEVLADLRGERANRESAAGQGGTAGGRSAAALSAGE